MISEEQALTRRPLLMRLPSTGANPPPRPRAQEVRGSPLTGAKRRRSPRAPAARGGGREVSRQVKAAKRAHTPVEENTADMQAILRRPVALHLLPNSRKASPRARPRETPFYSWSHRCLERTGLRPGVHARVNQPPQPGRDRGGTSDSRGIQRVPWHFPRGGCLLHALTRCFAAGVVCKR